MWSRSSSNRSTVRTIHFGLHDINHCFDSVHHELCPKKSEQKERRRQCNQDVRR